MAAERRTGESAVRMDAEGPPEPTGPLTVRLLLQLAGLRLENRVLQQRVAALEAQAVGQVLKAKPERHRAYRVAARG